MELHMQTHEWRRRLPDWSAAVCAGLVGGAVLMVLELLWSTTVSGESPWRNSHLIAAIVMGESVLESSSFSVGVVAIALLVHYLLGVVFGVALAILIAGFRYEHNPGMLEMSGVLFGAALYLFSFHGMSTFFPWMADLRGWATFIGHIVFGMIVVLAYPILERHRASP
jgi:hypothetical protein